MYSIGIDIGTTGCKAVIVDPSGNIISKAYEEYPLIIRSEEMIEQDAQLWWSLVCTVTRKALTSGSIDSNDVESISVASQGISFVPVDNDLNPMMNAITWLDTRAGEETVEILTKYSPEDIFRITGKRANAVYVLPKLMWIKKHLPEIFESCSKFLMTHDFILGKMTDKCITDHTMASGTMMYDVSRECWSQKLLSEFGIPYDKLPQIFRSGTNVGNLTQEAAIDIGLGTNTQVIVGGQDQKIAAYAVAPGNQTATLSLGTAGAMEVIVSNPVIDPSMKIPLFSYVTEGVWTLESVVSTAGACLKWLKNTLFPDLDYSELDTLAGQIGSGSNGLFFFPHFSGATSPFWINEAKGGFMGFTLDTKKEDIVRSLLEGIAYQINTNILASEMISGRINSIVMMGSGSLSDIWCKIISDVTKKKIIVLDSPDAAGLGAAMLASDSLPHKEKPKAADIYLNSRTYYPDSKSALIYKKQYQEYVKLESRLLNHYNEVNNDA
ncbi:MAG: xylulokinase [Saccharofermentanales bacterium]